MTYSFRSLPIGIFICEMTKVLQLELQSRNLAQTTTPVVILIYMTYSFFQINEAGWYARGCLKDWHDAIGEVDGLVQKQGVE